MSRLFLATARLSLRYASRSLVMPVMAPSRAVPGLQTRFQSTDSSLLALRNSIKSKDFINTWRDYQCLAANEKLLKELTLSDVGKLLSLLLRQPDQISKIINDLKKAGFNMDTADFNAISAYESPRWIYGESVVFLDAMRKHGAPPDLQTFKTLITSLAINDPVGAKNILDNEEPADEVPPDGVIYTELARGFLRMGDVDTAKLVLDEMVACEIKPDRASLESLVNDLMSSGNIVVAEQVMNEILGEKGALPGFGSDGSRT